MCSIAILAGMAETWTPPDPPKARVEREYAALFRIHQRHADSPERRARPGPTPMVGPGEAVRLLVSLAAGSSVVEDGEAGSFAMSRRTRSWAAGSGSWRSGRCPRNRIMSAARGERRPMYLPAM